ncbi:30S ribosome-binding factor RbfA [Candidatus Uhrbacteria bacterium]|nr:30S ribosome-binding factor RbfA [Candidatus Uhrbacteria bacterium]
MSSKRILQVNELIQQELSAIFRREIEFPPSALVTITRVNTVLDLKTAKVSVSIFPTQKYGTVLSIIKKRSPFIQSLLNKKLTMHHVPSLTYEIDPEMHYIDEVDKILDTLKK